MWAHTHLVSSAPSTVTLPSQTSFFYVFFLSTSVFLRPLPTSLKLVLIPPRALRMEGGQQWGGGGGAATDWEQGPTWSVLASQLLLGMVSTTDRLGK